jgi:hypothetical protein
MGTWPNCNPWLVEGLCVALNSTTESSVYMPLPSGLVKKTPQLPKVFWKKAMLFYCNINITYSLAFLQRKFNTSSIVFNTDLSEIYGYGYGFMTQFWTS